MTVAELGTILGVVFAIGGMIWKISAAITAMESRLNLAINQLRIESVTRKDIEPLRRRQRAVETFIAKNFSVDLERYEMD